MHKAPISALLMSSGLDLGFPSGPPAPTANDRQARLDHLLAEQEDAWDRGDGWGWAGNFSLDADFVNIRGDVFHGREAIGRLHTMILSGPYSGSAYSATIRQVTEPVPSIILLDADLAVTRYRGLPPGIAAPTDGVLRTRMKYVLREGPDGLEIVAAQNTVVLPTPPVRAADNR